MDVIFKIESPDIFTSVWEELLTDMYSRKQNYNCDIDPNILQTGKDDFKKLIQDCEYDLGKVAESLQSRNWDQERVKELLAIIEKKKSILLYSALMQHNSTYGETITDFNWLVKLVLGTNELKTMRYSLLQLILPTIDTDGLNKKRVYDVNKEVLSKIITLLENHVND